MDLESQSEIASSEVDDALSPVADNNNSDHIVHNSEGVVTNHPQIEFTISNSIRSRQVEETVVEEVDTSSTLQERVLNMEQFEKVIGLVVVVVTQMSESSEKQKDLSLGLLAAIVAVFAMESWVIPSCKVKWKFIIQIASHTMKLLAFYIALCILKPEWFSRCRFVIVCIIAIAYTCFDELNVTSQNASALYQDIKTKFTWCCEKGVLVINYMIDKVLKLIRKDQASPASAPTRASV
ncbi:hypothetical protein Tco_1172771 [Tanacetum coccineum]